MQTVDWSRAQFAMTAMFHWVFVPLTLGLGFICAFMETRYYRSGDGFWKRTARFWMKLFGINFACGVATGLILEFEFGTNWSNYSHFVGDIFGAPLAIEGIVAFFLESTFLAVMFFGWNRVSKRFHLTATWLTAVGATLSALWILVANAWMQYPVGTTFNIERVRTEMSDFWEIVLSPVAVTKFFHTTLSGYVLASVFVMGVSAWFLIRGRERRMALASIKIAGWFGLVCSVLLAVTGDMAGAEVARHQPMKLAAMEAHYDGAKASPLILIGAFRQNGPTAEESFRFKVEIPYMLSIMSFRDRYAFVPGINDLLYGNKKEGVRSVKEKMERGRIARGVMAQYAAAREAGDQHSVDSLARWFDPSDQGGKAFLSGYFRYLGYSYFSSPEETVPNVPLLFYSFRVMVGAGCYFILMFAVALWMLYRRKVADRRWMLRAMLWSVPLAYVAGWAGWIVTEVGRQPWTIYEMLPTVASVSHLDPGAVKTTFFIFLTLFTVLLAVELRIMFRQIAKGPDDPETETDK